MKTIPTVEGKFYCVATTTSCDVTTEAGTLLGTAAAGQPLWFQAQKGDTTTLSDDNAEYSASRFNSAPQQQLALLGVLGGKAGLPKGYTRVEYLESTGTQYIDTGYFPCWDTQISMSGVGVSQMAMCGCVLEKTQSSGWKSCYFLVSYDNGHAWAVFGNSIPGSGYFNFMTNLFSKFEYRADKNQITINGIASELNYPSEPEAYRSPNALFVYARNYNGLVELLGRGSIFGIHLSEKDVPKRNMVPCLSPTGATCMFDLVTRTPFYNSGTGSFIAGIETQTQLNNMLRRLPDRTGQDVGTLQVRLADALQTPENAAKMESMIEKNWEISQAA